MFFQSFKFQKFVTFTKWNSESMMIITTVQTTFAISQSKNYTSSIAFFDCTHAGSIISRVSHSIYRCLPSIFRVIHTICKWWLFISSKQHMHTHTFSLLRCISCLKSLWYCSLSKDRHIFIFQRAMHETFGFSMFISFRADSSLNFPNSVNQRVHSDTQQFHKYSLQLDTSFTVFAQSGSLTDSVHSMFTTVESQR